MSGNPDDTLTNLDFSWLAQAGPEPAPAAPPAAPGHPEAATAPPVHPGPDPEALAKQGRQQLEAAATILSEAVRLGTRDRQAWNLLAATYIATGRIGAYRELLEKYEHAFSAPLELPFAVSAETARKVFPLPQKIVEISLPDLAQVRKAAEAPQGAIVDFSGVHGADAAGLKALAKFFSGFPPNAPRPECAGIERLIGFLEHAAEGHGPTELVWEVLLAYKRFRGDVHGFEELALKYALKFHISPPQF
ncbi:MAG: hypothetical protein HYU77_08740 [Betaproteobacteria bacterium]|nr:hypothetical protein [Betaproteobacteria bacterium]